MGRPFEQLTQEMMDYYLSCDPSFATQVGWHKYDRKLRDPSPEATARQISDLKAFVRTLEGLPVESLAEDQLIDRDLALHVFKLRLFEMEELRLEERFSRACDDIAYSLFFLFVRDVPSFDERMESMVTRLEQTPELLAKSRATMKSPLRLWNEVSMETGVGLVDFIKEVGALVESKSSDPDLIERTRRATEVATEAVAMHLEWMRTEVLPKASSRFTVSLEVYERYLEKKQYGVSLEEALKIAEVYMDAVRREMANVARRMVPSGSIDEALARMKSDHPATAKEALKAYQESVSQARGFMLNKDLVTLPANERLIVMDTPSFMLPVTPFAAQYEPGKFDGNRTGLFVVSLDDANPESLREHSRAGIANTTVHEGYPGHHLQGICSNTHPSSVRVLIASPDFSEGWGLYSEQMMLSAGYNDTAVGHLTNLNDLLFRIARLLVEMKLVTGNMSIEDATRLFVRECGMNEDASAIEAKACAMSPTYYFSYFIGKLGIEQLREEVLRALGTRFSLKFFHDSLVYSGCMPMPFMRRAMALRVRKEYGIELGERKESLFEYAMRKAGR
jgi:uncharacterized protein (DUF885 family)